MANIARIIKDVKLLHKCINLIVYISEENLEI